MEFEGVFIMYINYSGLLVQSGQCVVVCDVRRHIDGVIGAWLIPYTSNVKTVCGVQCL